MSDSRRVVGRFVIKLAGGEEEVFWPRPAEMIGAARMTKLDTVRIVW